MPEIVRCSHCERKLKVADDHVGRKVRCPACQQVFVAETVEAVPLPPPVERSQPEEQIARERPLRPSAPPSRPSRPDDSADDLPPPRRRAIAKKGGSSAGWVIALVALLLFVGGAVGLVVYLQKRSSVPSGPLAAEAPEERRQDIAEAFRDLKPLADEEIAAAVKPVLEDLGAAFRAKNAQRIESHFNLERMLDEVAAQGGLPKELQQNREPLLRGMRNGMGANLSAQGDIFHWNQTEIRHVKKLNNVDVVVITTHRNQGEIGTNKMRWWLTRRTGSWKVFDMEDLAGGFRMTTTITTMLTQGLGRAQDTMEAVRLLSEAMQALVAQNDVNTAEALLQRMPRGPFAKPVESLKLLVTSLLQVQQGKFTEALATAEQARALQPDSPILDLIQGMALNSLGRWAEALKHLKAYHDLLGDDDTICLQLGEALRGLERFAEAAAAYRKALDCNPKLTEAFEGLLHSLAPGDKRDDLADRFLKLDMRRENFERFAEDCIADRDRESLEMLATAMRKVDPLIGSPDYYLALCKVWARQTEQAAPLIRAALKKEFDPETRASHLRGFMGAMVEAGKAAEAYDAVLDAREAFHFLAAELMVRHSTHELRQLIARHSKKHPNDPLLPYCQADLHVKAGQYALAEKAFQRALTQPLDGPTLALFRASRVLARFHTGGDVLAIYNQIEPRNETFHQLVFLCWQRPKLEALRQLLDAHEKRMPGDPVLLRFRCRLMIKDGQVARAVALFKDVLPKLENEHDRTELTNDFLREMADAGKIAEGYAAVLDPRQSFEVLAQDLWVQRRLPELRQLLDLQRRRDAEDPRVALYTGELHMEEKAWDRAAQVLREGLKKADEKLRPRLHSRCVYAMYRAGQALEAHAQIEPRQETFARLASLLLADRKAAELQALIDAHRPHAGDDADYVHREAQAKLLAGKTEEGIALLQQAYRKQTVQEVREEYVWTLIDELARQGKGLEGYRASPDRRLGFRTLANAFLGGKKPAELEKLLEEHRKADPGDVQIGLYTGELHLLRDEIDKAEGSFAEALRKVPAEQQAHVRFLLFRVRVKAGKAVATWREFRDDPMALEVLLSVCILEKQTDQLTEVIAARRQSSPDDPDLPAWELELKWLKKDYAGALKLMTEHAEALADNQRMSWKLGEYRVRALVRLNRAQEALKEAEGLVEGRADPLLLILAQAATGDVMKTIAALEKYRSDKELPADCYADEDLGPILRSDAFKAFRDRFPEPDWDGEG
jgi:predicted Zn-dependent protease